MFCKALFGVPIDPIGMGPTKPPNGISLMINTIAMIGTCANPLRGHTRLAAPSPPASQWGRDGRPLVGLPPSALAWGAQAHTAVATWLRQSAQSGACHRPLHAGCSSQATLVHQSAGQKAPCPPLGHTHAPPRAGPHRHCPGAAAGAIVHLGGSRVAAQRKHVSEQKLRSWEPQRRCMERGVAGIGVGSGPLGPWHPSSAASRAIGRLSNLGRSELLPQRLGGASPLLLASGGRHTSHRNIWRYGTTSDADHHHQAPIGNS